MTVAQNLQTIRTAIEAAAKAAGRDASSVRLLAVSKQQPPERVHGALDAGQRLFAENRVQEAQQRWGDLRKSYPDLKLHLIGPLQTNKAADAVALFDVIETLDREKLACVLAAEMRKQNKKILCLIQVNTGAESQKAGIDIAAFPAFLKFCRDECGLEIDGLMCIPPIDEPPETHFALLAKLAREHDLSELSMGMSGDYEDAIAQGATFIRVGTGVFGERKSD